jgi:hypothetical protein
VLASQDSSRAFIYVEDTAGQRLEVYNLNGPLQSGALYPLLDTIVLADSANSGPGPHSPVTMTSSLDDGTVFISGDGKLLVVPVDAGIAPAVRAAARRDRDPAPGEERRRRGQLAR